MKKKKIRMAYYPNPEIVKTYEEFLIHHTLDITECGDIFRDEYQQFLNESADYDYVTPIRYDYDESGYISIIHYASHLHIGLNSHMRIGLELELTPLAFTGLVVSYFFYGAWKKAMLIPEFCEKYLKHKTACDVLPRDFFTAEDKMHFYIT